ncbi:MAG: hypothetical protein WC761_00315 [Candidatus Paceibacterota bacterium]|jgi:hypothetical protein
MKNLLEKSSLPRLAPREVADQERFIGKLYQVLYYQIFHYFTEIPEVWDGENVGGYMDNQKMLRWCLTHADSPILRLRTVIHVDGAHFTEFLHEDRIIWIPTKAVAFLVPLQEK